MKRKFLLIMVITFILSLVFTYNVSAADGYKVAPEGKSFEDVFVIYNGESDISAWSANASDRLAVSTIKDSGNNNVSVLQHIPMNKGISMKKNFETGDSASALAAANQSKENLYLKVELYVNVDTLVKLPYTGSSGPEKRLTFELKWNDGSDVANQPRIKWSCYKDTSDNYVINLEKGWQTFYLPFNQATSYVKDDNTAGTLSDIDMGKMRWFGIYAANDRDEGSDFVDGKDMEISIRSAKVVKAVNAPAQTTEPGETQTTTKPDETQTTTKPGNSGNGDNNADTSDVSVLTAIAMSGATGLLSLKLRKRK